MWCVCVGVCDRVACILMTAPFIYSLIPQRSLPPVPWYAADSADVLVGEGAVQREEPPPPYDNDLAAVQQRPNQSRNHVSFCELKK